MLDKCPFTARRPQLTLAVSLQRGSAPTGDISRSPKVLPSPLVSFFEKGSQNHYAAQADLKLDPHAMAAYALGIRHESSDPDTICTL